MTKHTLQIILFVILLLVLLLYGLIWLSFGLAVSGGLYILFSSDLKVIEWIKRSFIMNFLLTVIGIFIFTILLRVFILEIYTIPSSSMENALFPGDKIIVSKINYGPKLPESPFEIPWVNLFFYFNKKAMAKGTGKWWGYRRLSGFTKTAHHDIVVFKNPGNENMYYIKRCIGFPGDSLKVFNGKVYINGAGIEEPPSVKWHYKAWFHDVVMFKKALTVQKDYFQYLPRKEKPGSVELFLSYPETELLNASGAIDSLSIVLVPPKKKPAVYPRNEIFPWSIDQYGPIRIPSKGMRIKLDYQSFVLYQSIINKYENQNLEQKDHVFYLNGRPVQEFTFKQNYYFMMGDNRHDSKDSRYIGFIPEPYIEGKAVMILFSHNELGIQWNRLFKKL